MADCAFDSVAYDLVAFDTCVPVVPVVPDNCEYDSEINGLANSGVPLFPQFAEEKRARWTAGENNLDRPQKIPFEW